MQSRTDGKDPHLLEHFLERRMCVCIYCKNRTKPAAPRLNYGSVPRDHLLAAVDHPHNKEQSGWISKLPDAVVPQ